MMQSHAPRFIVAVAALASLVAAPARAANKETQQMMADIRMLQEQTQLMQNLINSMMKSVDEALAKMNQRVDDQANATRKSFADEKLVFDGLSNDLRVVREKVDDNNVRIGSVSQEVQALRQALQQMAAPPPPVTSDATGAVPGTEPAPGAPGAAAPATGLPPPTAAAATPAASTPPEVPPPATPANIPIGASPQQIWNIAYGDYTAGQYDLAIQGFEAYIMTAPKSDQADLAQVYIGDSYLQDGKNELAIEAYDKAIRTYPTGDAIPEAYFHKGLALLNLGQKDQAQEALQYAATNFPDAAAGILAKQRLEQLP
jgi:TolA-binding protein